MKSKMHLDHGYLEILVSENIKQAQIKQAQMKEKIMKDILKERESCSKRSSSAETSLKG